ncbi:virB8 family protein [Caballeronia sp. SBC2]|uniref:virB8 family protein n=1 Tax=Caballeronia sp. SBC2 TaxID=2705547 RepID=UPI0013E9EFF4|nr:type IV secretion system protein [Caballeronia sp. SBC2]
MMFKRKEVSVGASTDAAGTSATKEPTAIEMGKWYLKQAMLFEKSKQEAQKRITQLALRGAIGALVVAAVSIVGSSALVLLKRPNPPAVLRVNTANGFTDVLDVATEGHMSFTEAQDRADLRRYVEMRESYDWETIQDLFNSVKLMSAEQERDVYVKLFALPNAPQKVLKDQYRIVARVGPITFVGSTAQVFFSKKLIPLGSGQQPKTEYWVATISYRHEQIPEKRSELDVNPNGFRVTSFTVDRDWTRSTDATAAAPTVPSMAAQGSAQ